MDELFVYGDEASWLKDERCPLLAADSWPLPPLSAVQPRPSSGPINHVIVFYRNGIFTVNDGPPRRVDDRANFAFIDSISKVCGRGLRCVSGLLLPLPRQLNR